MLLASSTRRGRFSEPRNDTSRALRSRRPAPSEDPLLDAMLDDPLPPGARRREGKETLNVALSWPRGPEFRPNGRPIAGLARAGPMWQKTGR